MQAQIYDFDPCTIDGSDIEEVLSIDTWKPRAGKTNTLVKSRWRETQNAGCFNLEPGIDDIKKIKMHLKKKIPDYQIMDTFGITSEVLVAIKRDCYGPVNGISLDNQSKIYIEFNKVNERLDRAFNAFSFIANNLFATEHPDELLAFKAILGKKKRKRRVHDDDE